MIWWKYLPEISHKIWTVKSPWNDREKPVKRPWKNPWKATKNLRLSFTHFFGYFVVCSRVFHWNLWNHWSFQAVLPLIDLKLVDAQLLLLSLWSVCGVWRVSPYICYLYIYIYYEGTWYKRFFWTCFATPFLGSQAETMISAWWNCSVEFCQRLKSPHNWKTLGASCHFLFGKLAVQTNV